MRKCLLLLVCTVVQTLLPAAAETTAPSFQRCLAAVQQTALKQGISAESFRRYTGQLQPDLTVLELLNAQPEFTTPIWDYLAGLVDQQRIDDGRDLLQQHAALLQRIEQQYGVDKETVVAVWGVESDYGRLFGKRPLLTSLATLSCFDRRQTFFRQELLAVIKLLQQGDLTDPALTGSWAGAFGHTQFMPSTYARIAVDFDGDGRRDLLGSIPDALASTANYLKKSGWQAGQHWGVEVRLPAGFPTAQLGRTKRKPQAYWASLGVRQVGGQPLAPIDTRSAIIAPAGIEGPAFLVYRNYDAIYSYNAAESYALAIALLSDHLRGQSGPVAAWPTDDPGLSREERKELQRLLQNKGHDVGAVDGLIGNNTRRAIRAEQLRLGIEPTDGRAGKKILQRLRES